MKAGIATIIALLVTGYAWSTPQMPMNKEIQVGIAGVYIPSGFDEESDTFVVVNGMFPNGCYSWKRAEVASKGFEHDVKVFANVTGGMCLAVLLPFTEEVSLGQLPSGTHKVRFHNGDGTHFQKLLLVD